MKHAPTPLFKEEKMVCDCFKNWKKSIRKNINSRAIVLLKRSPAGSERE
jgi:hypothetical protein